MYALTRSERIFAHQNPGKKAIEKQFFSFNFVSSILVFIVLKKIVTFFNVIKQKIKGMWGGGWGNITHKDVFIFLLALSMFPQIK